MRNSTWTRAARGLLVGVVASALLSTSAIAQEDAPDEPAPSDVPAFAVQPSGPDGPGGRDFFIYDLEPGDTFGDTVAVSNLSDEPIQFALYPTDAYNTEDGAAFTLLREEEDPVDVGSWIQLAADVYTVDPGTRIDVPFSVTVPEDASPGDHAGAIVAQPLVPDDGGDDGDDGFSFDVRLRIGARVYVRVGGDLNPELGIPQLDVDPDQGLGPTSGRMRIEYVVRNTGNLRLTPTARLRVTGPFGMTVRELPARQLPELLPGGEITIAETVRHLPLVGHLDVELDVVAEGVDLHASTGVWAVPWIFSVLLLPIGGLWWRRRRRRRRASGGPKGGTPASGAAKREREPVPV